MRRRELLGLLGTAAITWPNVARAQQADRPRRIGVVMAYSEKDPNGQLQVTGFRQQLQKLGWTEGRNIQIDFRYAADNPTHIRELAIELLGLGPDLMVSNSNVVTTILQSEVRNIPLLFISVSDPIGSGFVKELARPGGNVTGFANFQPTMGGKWFEKLHEVAPHVRNVGLVMHPEPPNFGYLRSAEAAAASTKLNLVRLDVHNAAEIERALATMGSQSDSGLIVAPNVVTFANSALIVALAAHHRFPAIYPFAFFTREGGLLSYGFDAVDQFRQGAIYVNKILRGVKPSDLPVQHPTTFELAINLKTAQALGLVISRELLLLADELIE
jgi:putative tryptophan/tyrosine transport system substrate-binding protein